MDELDHMMAEAKKKRLWFYTKYHDLWLSPKELEAKWADSRFGRGNRKWRLRDPKEYLAILDRRIASAIAMKAMIQKRINE